MASEEANTTTCYRWSCDFVVAHAVFASGFVTAPVAVLHLIKRPHSGRALFFAIFAVFCTTFSLVLCCRFYAELKRPPCWRCGGRRRRQDGGGQESTSRDDEAVSHDLRHPDPPVMFVLEMQAALAAGLVPSYEHPEDGGGADCAVCLGEVEKGESVRRLPACRHVFHKECIDLWLTAHATCPVCRRGVLPTLPERPPAEVVVTIDAVDGPPGPA